MCSFPIIERFFKSALSAEGIGTGEDVQFREELTRNLRPEFRHAEMVEFSNWRFEWSQFVNHLL